MYTHVREREMRNNEVTPKVRGGGAGCRKGMKTGLTMRDEMMKLARRGLALPRSYTPTLRSRVHRDERATEGNTHHAVVD